MCSSFLLQWEYVLLGDYRKRLLDERHMVGIIRCVRRDETKRVTSETHRGKVLRQIDNVVQRSEYDQQISVPYGSS